MSSSSLLTKLLDYVVEQSKDIDPRGFRLSGTDGFLRTSGDLRGLPGVDLDIKVEGDHIWLRVARLEAQNPPTVPPEQKELFVVDSNPTGKLPRINEAALERRIAVLTEGEPETVSQQLADSEKEAIEVELERYTRLWQTWAEVEKPRWQAIRLYGELFSLKQQLELEDTAKPQEFVCGIGVASWKMSFEERTKKVDFDYQYPVLTQSLELAIDDRTLAIEVRPRAVGPRIEFDAFSACQLQSAAAVERAVKEELERSAERPPNPFDPGTYEHALRSVAGNIDRNGKYIEGQVGLPPAGPSLLVTDLWVFHSRPRSNNFLHEDIERLKAHLKEGAEIPEGPLALVTPPADEKVSYEAVSFRGLAGTPSSGSGKTRELYFPLPYNHEQVTIVEQLERSDGVAVQGPPGTGKTHTIANIICHYLANGKKILVTSKGEKALELLQEKIPEEVRPLTVALLSGDRQGMQQFQASIEAIIHQVSQMNPDVVASQIQADLSAIDRAHTTMQRIDRRIDEIAMTQLSDVEVDGVVMRAQKMAEFVIEGGKTFSWFDDSLSLAPENAPPLVAEDVRALREARRNLGSDIGYVSAHLPSSAALLTVDDVRRLHTVMVNIASLKEAEAQGTLIPLRATTDDVYEHARDMLAKVDAAVTLAIEIEETEETWPFDLRRKCRRADHATERMALEALFGESDQLMEARSAFMQRPVKIDEAALGSPKVKEALERAVKTGKPFGMFVMGAGDAKEMVAAIRIAEIAPKNEADWQHVLSYVNLHEKVASFCARWNEFANVLDVPRLTPSVTQLRHIERVTIAARKAHAFATNHDAHLTAVADKVFAVPPVDDLRGGSEQLSRVREYLRQHLSRVELAQATTNLSILREKLAGTRGPVAERLRDFAENRLGEPALPAEKAAADYAELVAELRRVEGLFNELEAVRTLSKKIETAGAVRLAARLRSVPVPAAGEDVTWPASWREAWNWARVRDYLESIEARQELIELAAQRRDVESGLSRLYSSIVSKSAWLSTKMNATPKVLSALETYRTAIRRIGAGTGPNAVRHRRDAQKAMHDAQDAVPCWVMSHAKVSETLPASLGAFDLVIVDEASQSDLWALPAVLRGKKILVVGDDRQVSPDGGFISAVRIQELKDRFLADQPHAPVLTPEKSLYDIASTVFAAQKVMLREHFRCVPPIIAYSNKHFYKDFIQPLRIPKMSQRIDPPLVDIYVPHGLRDKRDINRAEAEAIVAEIQAVLANPQFAHRTLGVVTLLGPEQGKFIDALVRERCDAAELHRRKFACGDARTFQGAERHIIFLSLVIDSSGTRALSDQSSEQRFNVAASRAQDRMYLVRSVKLSELSASGKDLRAGLLQHFSMPIDQQGNGEEEKSLIDLCESGFERQVYAELVTRGYRVIPQVKAGAFRIDMVVEGANDARLAIELDGDEFHGPDRWQADMNRQRVLERAGWVFWRCFASTWSMRREEVLNDLLARMYALGIEPLGAIERVPALVEYREWNGNGEELVDDEQSLAQSLA
ncbi:AAA domain-containing protein [Burkholderia contaminans]|uniref:AAA domain-containing protein n=1 Tax=Burkholderia contaminans TaxID=488447 RepID=UPI000F58DDDA|nr:AAA domain-containing protein [Burkholderia contaminans]RQT40585.1 very short patch repair endonuclease [Burkholderia contaminans]